MKTENILANRIKLKPLELSKTRSVGDIVNAMNYCAAGAGMLGAAAITLEEWTQSPRKPLIIHDGGRSALRNLLQKMVREGMCERVLTSDEFVSLRSRSKDRPAVIVGTWTERNSEGIFKRAEEAIYVNPYGLSPPGRWNDGHYPNVVFSDERFIMPTLYRALDEWGNGRRWTATEFTGWLRQFGGMAAETAKGTEVSYEMFTDPKCDTIFMSLAGIMTVAQLGPLIRDMIDCGLANFVASTGALMGHGLIQASGLAHYRHDPRLGDEVLLEHGINRVSTAHEDETNFDHIEEIVGAVLQELTERKRPIAPSAFHREIGRYVKVHYPQYLGILRSAFEQKVPICVPAFTDSELFNDIDTFNRRQRLRGKPPVRFDPELDNHHLVEAAVRSRKMGIFTIGGGPPRNWLQNVCPLLHLINRRKAGKVKIRRYSYGVRIDSTPPWFMNLSGARYTECVAWGKFYPDAKIAEIMGCATLPWPFILKSVLERMKRPRKSRIWN